jgi:hypothetical protein
MFLFVSLVNNLASLVAFWLLQSLNLKYINNYLTMLYFSSLRFIKDPSLSDSAPRKQSTQIQNFNYCVLIDHVKFEALITTKTL